MKLKSRIVNRLLLFHETEKNDSVAACICAAIEDVAPDYFNDDYFSSFKVF